jgi:hypothetical protein
VAVQDAKTIAANDFFFLSVCSNNSSDDWYCVLLLMLTCSKFSISISVVKNMDASCTKRIDACMSTANLSCPPYAASCHICDQCMIRKKMQICVAVLGSARKCTPRVKVIESILSARLRACG